MGDLPDPPVPSDADLRGLKFMPLDVVRLMDSDIFALSTGDEFKAAVALWCKSWVQVPAGSLPKDDRILAHLTGAGSRWKKVKSMALHGFVECSDGRLYHPVVCEKVLDAWKARSRQRERGLQGSVGKWGASANPAQQTLRHERLAEARRKGTHTKDEWEALVGFCGGLCVRCGNSVQRPVKDHVTPIYQGGSDAIDNLQPMCGSCNSSKGSDTTDYRPDGWEIAVKTPNEMPALPGISEPETPGRTPGRTPVQRLPERLLTPDKGQGQGQGQGRRKNSEAKASARDGPSVDPAKELFDAGVRVLTELGVEEKRARSIIGQHRKTLHDDGRLLAILLSTRRESPVEPVAYLEKAVQRANGGGFQLVPGVG